jgi:uncharacterized protein YjbI with pentapeptide repeats
MDIATQPKKSTLSITNLPHKYTEDILRKLIKPNRGFDQVVKGNIKIIKIKDDKIESQNLNYNYKIIFRKIGKFLVYQTWDKDDSVKIYFPKGEHNSTRTLRQELKNNPDAKDVLELTINNDRLVNLEDFKLWITQAFYQKKMNNKQPFQPTTVMEIGNKKFVFVITNAEITPSDKVVFYISTKEIRLQNQNRNQNNNMKKMIKLPRGRFKNVRFDIDSLYDASVNAVESYNNAGVNFQYACPSGYFINSYSSVAIMGCTENASVSAESEEYYNNLGYGNFKLPSTCLFGAPTGTLYNVVSGNNPNAMIEFSNLSQIKLDPPCPCGAVAISTVYIAFFGTSPGYNYGTTADCNQNNNCANGNQCSKVQILRYDTTNVPYGEPPTPYFTWEDPTVIFEPSVPYTDEGYIMAGWFLSNADFTNCNLDGMSFFGATFSSNTKFTGASLVGAKFYSNNFEGKSDVFRTNLTGVNFSDIDDSNGGLTNADFREATLVNVNFSGPGNGISGTNLTGANFTNANLTGANVTNANFTNAILTGTNLSNVFFNNGVNLQGITSGNITNGPASLPFVEGGRMGNYILFNGYIVGETANLTNANLYGLDLTKVSLFETILTGVSSGDIYWYQNLSIQPDLPTGYTLLNGYIFGPDVNLSGVDLSYFDLSNLNLSHANLENAIMNGTNISNTNLGSANLNGLRININKPLIGYPALPSGYQLIHGIIIGTNITIYSVNSSPDAILSNLDFSNIQINYSTFYGVDFSYSNFTNTAIINSTFENCIFSGAIVTNTNFNGTIFTGVRISIPLIGQPAIFPSLGSIGPITSSSFINGFIIGPTMDLRGANLSGLNLSNINMENANITGANMTGVITGGITGPLIMSPQWQLTTNGYLLCPGSNLSNLTTQLNNIRALGLDLTGVNFENTILYGLVFDNSIMVNANLNNAQLTASFRGVDFTNAILTNMNNTILNNGRDFSVDFTNAKLKGANVSGSNLFHVIFQGNNGPVIGGNSGTTYYPTIVHDNGYMFILLDYSSPGSNCPDLSGANMNIFSNRLSLYYLSYANFTGCNFSGVDISKLDLQYATLTGVISDATTGQNYTLPTNWSLINGYLVGPGANFTNQPYLYGLNLSGINLTGANFSGANLTNTNLTNSNLTGANFSGANLTNANLSNANLTGAILSTYTGVIGSGLSSSLSANFNNTNLTGAILSGVVINGEAILNFNNVNFNNANFTGADFSCATFNGAFGTEIIGIPKLPTTGYAVINGSLLGRYVSLQGRTFTNNVNLLGKNLDFTGANFTYAESDGTITPANLTQGQQDSPDSPIFPENYTILQGYVIGPDVYINSMTLSDVIFSKLYNNIVSLNNVNFSATRFTNLDFTLPNSNFTIKNASLSGMSFFNSNCTNVDFTGTRLTNMQFSNVNLTGANFTKATFSGYIIFQNVTLNGANFSGADLSAFSITNPQPSITFQGVYLTGADFSKAIFGNEINFTYLQGTDGMLPINGAPILPYNLYFDQNSGTIGQNFV